MSISGALSNALSGLTASSRSADVAASNIANVMTDGYGVREVVLSPRAIGDDGGVRVNGVRRHVDAVLLADRRNAEAALSNETITRDFLSRVQVRMGLPHEEGSLNSTMTKLEASLTEATLAPESESLLQTVVADLEKVASTLNELSDVVQEERVRADTQIDVEVQRLNTTLVQIDELNDSIRKHLVLDHDVSAMLDQRQRLVDEVNKIVPVTEIDRGHGDIALMTSGGVFLLDGRPATFSFTKTSIITPNLTLSGGTLSGLTVNGRDVETSQNSSDISGGTLDALFQVRDLEAVEFQTKLDGFARDLIERFEDPSVDPTRVSTDPGLLTDSGTLFDSTNEVGLSQRIEVNALVVPSQGGEVWRIRDGLGVSSPIPGGEGNSALINRISGTLTSFLVPSSGAFSSGSRSAAGLATELVSYIGGKLETAKTSETYSRAQYDTLKEMELAKGVDSDAEMQRLLLIEQAYAANARVVQVADEMLDWLMRI